MNCSSLVFWSLDRVLELLDHDARLSQTRGEWVIDFRDVAVTVHIKRLKEEIQPIS